MMRVLFLAYPEFADFEIGHVLFLLRKIGKAEIVTSTVTGEAVTSLGGLKVMADCSVAEVDVTQFNLILVSGGDGIAEVLENETVSALLQSAVNHSILIASICASALLLGKAGVLHGGSFTCLTHTYEKNIELFAGANYTGEDIAVWHHVITAKGTAFAEFAVETCNQLGMFQTNEQYEARLKFCKGIS
ncbi:DJ-1/PfpI family protein [Cytobacillus horneckiae]|nr:DJ-1/PfpI family protein [Cytobacillus horneckiae]